MGNLAKEGKIRLIHVNTDAKGHIDLHHLRSLLEANPGSLVSLMHANNEIGNLLDLDRVAELCDEFKAYFHSDTVQTVGHYRHNLSLTKVHGITAGAHKFHGPKGVGFMFIRKDKKIRPFVLGGGQERNMRGGTENVYGIVGMAKALEIAYREMDEHENYIRGLKQYMIENLLEQVPGVDFHGDSANLTKSLYTVLNVCLPESENNDMILFNLDLHGISASGGSACSSGAQTGSHVLGALYPESKK